jgi:hypothetical protein
MPRMWVMLCRANAYEMWIDQNYQPELQGLERHRAQRGIAESKPNVVQ